MLSTIHKLWRGANPHILFLTILISQNVGEALSLASHSHRYMRSTTHTSTSFWHDVPPIVKNLISTSDLQYPGRSHRLPTKLQANLVDAPFFEPCMPIIDSACNKNCIVGAGEGAYAGIETEPTTSLIASTTSFHLNYQSSEPLTQISAINNLVENPSFWAISIMLSIVGLLYVWEESIHTLQKNIPKAFEPVIDSMLAEVGGLGFIGLFLEIFVTRDPDHGLGNIVGYLSERFLGEKEILLEAFESLHSTFFEVGVSYFLVAGVIVGAVLTRINELSQISEMALDTDKDGEVSLEELANALNAEVLVVDTNGDGVLSEDEISNALRSTGNRGFFDELSLSVEQRASEILLVRERFITQKNLPDSFLVEKYFEQIFAHNLKEMVELSPLTWLPLIPLISVLDAVDLSNEVVSASSSNAAISCGCFITSPWFLISSIAAQVLSVGWCVYNFSKLTTIKNMLIPTLVRNRPKGEVTFLPPRYEDEKLRSEIFQNSPLLIKLGAPVERFFGGKPARNHHESLFGAAGANGKDLFLTSIKIHTWLCVSQIIFLFGQIVERDLKSFFDYKIGTLGAESIGNLDMLVPELLVFSTLVILAGAQLILSPTIFLTYSTATSVEEMTADWAIQKARIKS